MEFGESRFEGDVFETQFFGEMFIDVFESFVEKLHVLLALGRSCSVEDIFLMVIILAEADEKLQQQGLDYQVREFSLTEVFVPYLKKDGVDIAVNLRIFLFGQKQRLRKYGHDPGKAGELCEGTDIHNEDKAASRGRSLELMKYSGRNDEYLCRLYHIGNIIAYRGIYVFYGNDHLDGGMPVGSIVGRLLVHPDAVEAGMTVINNLMPVFDDAHASEITVGRIIVVYFFSPCGLYYFRGFFFHVWYYTII